MAALIERVEQELRAAMKAGERDRVASLRLLLAALQRAAGERSRGSFGDEDALAVLRQARKQRVEAATAYRDAGQEERAAHEERDLPVIDELLPAAVSQEELERLVDEAIAETGATGMRDMGRVMGLVTARSQGRAEGRAAAELVRRRLAGPASPPGGR
jgi:uncharacterized protein YqeY